MSTKMKGLLKGLRYISQIFDEEKEQEMQIGFPTDVKHVAHIGWDGPTVDSPSWMKEFKSSTGFQSAPLGPPGDSRDDSEIKWVSEVKDPPELPKSSRRHSSTENNTNDSPRKKDSSTKSRQPRKHQSKDSSDSGLKSSSQQPQELSLATSSPPRSLPDIPRKSRRKKSKESVGGGGSTRSRSKGTTSNGTDTSTYSDPGPDGGPILLKPSSRLSPIPSLDDEETESRVTSKE
ncbi:hypothetical protein Pfo_017635 [Paulownia fortunei]|nr:hypothetical protein Pfo_017635 [Paulownia fortunei]